MLTATKGRTPANRIAEEIPDDGEARSLRIATGGIATAGEFKSFMSALMSDLIDGRVNANVGNAAVNAGGKLLKIVEMQLKYGKPLSLLGD